MVDVTCVRGAGDLPGPDVVEPILSDPAAAVHRGTAEIDAREPHSLRVVTVAYSGDVRRGEIVSVDLGDGGDPVRGLVEDISISADAAGVFADLKLRVPQ